MKKDFYHAYFGSTNAQKTEWIFVTCDNIIPEFFHVFNGFFYGSAFFSLEGLGFC